MPTKKVKKPAKKTDAKKPAKKSAAKKPAKKTTVKKPRAIKAQPAVGSSVVIEDGTVTVAADETTTV